MVAVHYPAVVALDPSSEQLAGPGLVGQVVAAGTSTPLTITEDKDGLVPIVDAQLAVTSQSLVPGFWCQDGTVEAEWVSGDYRIPMYSMTGLQGAADDAAVAAQASADQAAANVQAAADVAAQETADQLAADYVPRTEVGVTVESTAGAQAKADAAETAAKDYAVTLAYGTDLQATDVVVAGFVDDTGSETGAALNATYAPVASAATASIGYDGRAMTDPPTVTVETASALTGPWFRPRTGGGGSGSTVDPAAPFLYLGVSSNPLDAIAPHATNSYPWYNTVVSTHKTVANTVNPTHPIQFVTDAESVEVDVIGTGGNIRVSIDGLFTSEQMLDVPSGERFVRIAGLDGAPHLITFEQYNLAFAGVRVDSFTRTVTKPRLTGPTAVVFGDSYTSGALQTLMAYPRILGRRLGIANLIESGVGSTGYTVDGSEGNVRFVTRINNDIVNREPSLVIVAGGHNDASTDLATLETASLEFWTSLRNALPTTQLVCVGPIFETDTDVPFWQGVQEAIFNGARGSADVLLDTCADPIFTGTGNDQTPQGDGNADLYINGNDLPHPNLAGQNHIAHWLLARLSSRVPPPAPASFVPQLPKPVVTSVFVPSTAFEPSAGSPALTTKVIAAAWGLDSGTSESVSSAILPAERMPGWGSFNTYIVWATATGGSGDVRFRFDSGEVAPAGGTIASTGILLTATAPTGGTTSAASLVPGVITVSDPNNVLYVRVYRLGADAADTLGEDAEFLGVLLTRAS